MSNVRAEVLRVSRTRSGWRDGGSNPKSQSQRPYISALKSTFEGSTNNEKQRTEAPSPPKTGSGGCDSSVKSSRPAGTKVSTIANMFQAMTPTKDEIYHARPGFAKPESPKSEHDRKTAETVATEVVQKSERRDPHPPQDNGREPGGSVHLTRTESHLARFNNARAMFERLQEQGLRAKGGSSSGSTKKRSGSVSPSRSTTVRTSLSPTRPSRSPSPADSQSVGCSPKRDSPLSPKDKSRSADSILNEQYCRKSAMSPTICQSSHVNGRGHHPLNLDLMESGAGEAIISPDPLTPELAAYLQEEEEESPLDEEPLTPNGGGEDLSRALVIERITPSSKDEFLHEARGKFLYGTCKPATLSPKPTTDLSRKSSSSPSSTSSSLSSITTSSRATSTRHAHATTVTTSSVVDKGLGTGTNRSGSAASSVLAAQRPRVVSATPAVTVARTRLAEERSKSHIPQLQKDPGISCKKVPGRQPVTSSATPDGSASIISKHFEQGPTLISVIEKKDEPSPLVPLSYPGPRSTCQDQGLQNGLVPREYSGGKTAATATASDLLPPPPAVPAEDAPDRIADEDPSPVLVHNHVTNVDDDRSPVVPDVSTEDLKDDLLQESGSVAAKPSDDRPPPVEEERNLDNVEVPRPLGDGLGSHGPSSDGGVPLLTPTDGMPCADLQSVEGIETRTTDEDTSVIAVAVPSELIHGASSGDDTESSTSHCEQRGLENGSSSCFVPLSSETAASEPVVPVVVSSDILVLETAVVPPPPPPSPPTSSNLAAFNHSNWSEPNSQPTDLKSVVPSDQVSSESHAPWSSSLGVNSQGTSPLSPPWEGLCTTHKDHDHKDEEAKPATQLNDDVCRKEEVLVPTAQPVPTKTKALEEPEPMTPEEAEVLLSSKWRPEILSDEEATEAKMLLKSQDTTAAAIREKAVDGIMVNDVSEEVTGLQSVGHDGPMGRDDKAETVGSVDENPEEEDDEEPPEEEEYDEDQEEEEEGVHYLADGHFWVEMQGLPESDDDDPIEMYHPSMVPKKRDRVSFSTNPIRVYSTFSVTDYDRRNDDVDPVSASAEYELEKRVEKMDVFPVELVKGPEGLGLSIIGMGVGADAGLEKLGIFVKTITEGGAAHRDGRIRVNDQIIEVDGKSLVGVTQAYAASVLRNTTGLVRFLIGREKDGENSEVAQLISQSLQADRERDERRKAFEQQDHLQQQRPQHVEGESRSEGYPGLTLPIPSLAAQHPSGPQIMVQEDSTPEEGDDGPTCEVFDLEDDSSDSASPESDVISLRIKLKEAQYKNAVVDAELLKSKTKVAMLEALEARHEDYDKRLQALTSHLTEKEKEVMTYQDMLEESQGQYIVLEKKYYKAKKLIKEFQQRQQDLVHREEYHVQQLLEKDQEYNSLVKSLKDRVIQLEQDLIETQKAAGLPVRLPYDNTSIKQLPLTPQQLRKTQTISEKRRSSRGLEFDVSDSELSDTDLTKYDISPDSDEAENKTSTVERKPTSKDDVFEKAVPQTELLDSTAAKAKAELASKGSLANRQPPSIKKTGSTGSSGDGGSMDQKDSDSSASPTSSREDLDELAEQCQGDKTSTSTSLSSDSSPAVTPLPYSDGSSGMPKGPALDLSGPSENNASPVLNETRRNVAQFQHAIMQQRQLTTSVTTQAVQNHSLKIDSRFAEEMRIILERKTMEAKRQVDAETVDQFGVPVEKPAGHTLPSVSSVDVARNLPPGPGSTLSMSSTISNATSGSDPAFSRSKPIDVTAVSHSTKRDSALVDRSMYVGSKDADSGISMVAKTQQPQSIIGDHGVGGSGGIMPGNFPERRPHQWLSCSVLEWSVSQVGQWLLALNMEQYIPPFVESHVTGQELMNMTGAKLKSMGIGSSTDRSVLKKKIKELKIQMEKERKAVEKELKSKEKQQRKADKAAEKANKKN